MANIRKSFNFRNGVQVDDDNFIVNPNGLVGIGTSIPTEFLDVHGTAKITGLVTATNLAVTGVSTFYDDVKISGDVTATTFFGSAAGLTGIFAISTSGWNVNAESLSTTSKVGIGTEFPLSQLDVVGDVKVSGIITASSFSGYQVLVGTESSEIKTFSVRVAPKTSNHRYPVTGSSDAYFIDGIESPFLTLLPGKTYIFDQSDSSNIGNRLGFYLEADGTTPYNDTNVTTSAEDPGSPGSYTQIIVTDTTPVILHYQSSSSAYMGNAAQFNSNIVNTPYQITTLAGISATTGVVAAYSFSGFGTNIQGINATNITNGTLSNSRLAQNVSISGIISAPSGIITSLTNTNLNSTGIATLGNVIASQLYVSGVTTSLQGFVGNLTGTASTALSLSGTPDITVGNINNTGIATLGNIISSNINNTGIATLGNVIASRLYVSGVTTSLQGFVGDVTGTASTALSLSGTPNISVGNIDSVGIITSSQLYVSGVTTSLQGFVGDVTGTASTALSLSGTPDITVGIITSSQLYVSGVTTSLQGFVGDVTGTASTALSLSGTPDITVGNINVSEINSSNINASGIVISTEFIGNLTGTATTASSITGIPNINVSEINSSSINASGIVTITNTLYVIGSSAKIGVGTDTEPVADIEINKPGNTSISIISSDDNIASIGIGRSAEIKTGNTSILYPYSTPKSLDIINSSPENINYYLDYVYGSAGVGTGNFNWIYGQNPYDPLMSLSYTGNLGLGITDSSSKLYVVGTSYITGITTIDSDLNVTGNLGLGITDSSSKLYVVGTSYITGITTIDSDLNVTGDVIFSGSLNGDIGITTLSRLGISTDNISDNSYEFFVGGDPEIGEGVAITKTNIRASGDIQSTNIISTNIISTNINNSGIITSPSFVGDLTGNVIGENIIGDVIGIQTSEPIGVFQVGSESVYGIVVVATASTIGISTTIIVGIDTSGISLGLQILEIESIIASGTTVISIGTSQVGIGTTTLNVVEENDMELEFGNIINDQIFTIDNNKSVGIGTINPTSKLHVVGDVLITGATTSQNGFTSGIGVTDPVQITVSGNTLTFNVVGVGSTSLTLF